MIAIAPGPFPMDVTILLPTRGRRDLVGQRLAEIPHRPLLLIVDAGRRDLDLPKDLRGADVCECEPGCGAPKAFEAGVLACKTDWCVMLMDDCDCRADLVEVACAEYRYRFGARPAVVALNDGVSAGKHACVSLFSKEFYLNHVYPVQYQRYYIDTELGDKAHWLGCFGYAPNAIAKHFFAEGQDRQVMAEDSQLFAERMHAFRSNTPRYQPHLMVGLPIYGNAHPMFIQGLISLTAQPPCKVSYRFNTWNSLVSLARNQLTTEFLAGDFTHLLFIDADIGFNAGHVAQLLARDCDIVGGLYPYKRAGAPEYVSNALTPPPPEQDGLQQLKYIGTGFLMVKRRVFEIMMERFPDLAYRSDYTARREYDFWSVGVREGRHLSEDWSFCQRALDLNFKIYGDTRVKLRHAGTVIYPTS